ncbi:hypothetical protein EROM_101450 [Encephalitozoon romaleae SJ-2008]|uniref:Uncharacterized protein n=1 Tax=Encephalitozoon romaleae (strain SJ-2008) TaxID=1178016 RepID=I7AGQ1_ENCRO|nr:hypothetical protein EROM_101450 [Encephalitozoon romaleae SJ-2008]AFN83960.1 hypothetical protein EROM_101450 [Encephalitozoon romaleae SJ-2008]
MAHFGTNNLFNILDEIQNQILREEKPNTRKKALEDELHKLYLHTSLEICKQRLRGSVNKDTLSKVGKIKQYFKHIENIQN